MGPRAQTNHCYQSPQPIYTCTPCLPQAPIYTPYQQTVTLPPSAIQPALPSGWNPAASPVNISSHVKDGMLVITIPADRNVALLPNNGPAIFVQEIYGRRPPGGTHVDEYKIRLDEKFTPSETDEFLAMQIIIDGKPYPIDNPWKKAGLPSTTTETEKSAPGSDTPPREPKLMPEPTPPGPVQVPEKEMEPMIFPKPVEAGVAISNKTTNEALNALHNTCSKLITGNQTCCSQVNVNTEDTFHGFHYSIGENTERREIEMTITTVHVRTNDQPANEMDSLTVRRRLDSDTWRLVHGEYTKTGEEKQILTEAELTAIVFPSKMAKGERNLDLRVALATKPDSPVIVAGSFDRSAVRLRTQK